MLACNFELVQKGKQTAVSKYKNRKQRPNGQKHKREYNSMQSSHRQGRNDEKHNVSMMASEQIGPESQNSTQQRITIGTVLNITVSNGDRKRR
jgi:hypothetical protein